MHSINKAIFSCARNVAQQAHRVARLLLVHFCVAFLSCATKTSRNSIPFLNPFNDKLAHEVGEMRNNAMQSVTHVAERDKVFHRMESNQITQLRVYVIQLDHNLVNHGCRISTATLRRHFDVDCVTVINQGLASTRTNLQTLQVHRQLVVQATT